LRWYSPSSNTDSSRDN